MRKVDGEDDTGEGETSGGVPGRRRLTLMLVFGAIVILLGVSGVGRIPVPNSTANATLMHVPVILAGILGGPFAGLGAGLAFGGFSWVDSSAPIFRNPLVALLPRCAIGLVAWAVFLKLRTFGRSGLLLASSVAAALGSATNTVGVLLLAVLFARFPASAIPSVIPQAILEMVFASVFVAAVVFAADRFANLRN